MLSEYNMMMNIAMQQQAFMMKRFQSDHLGHHPLILGGRIKSHNNGDQGNLEDMPMVSPVAHLDRISSKSHSFFQP